MVEIHPVVAVMSGVPTTIISIVLGSLIWYALYRRMLCLIVGVPMGERRNRALMDVFDV